MGLYSDLDLRLELELSSPLLLLEPGKHDQMLLLALLLSQLMPTLPMPLYLLMYILLDPMD